MTCDPHEDHKVSKGSFEGLGHEANELMWDAIRAGTFVVLKAAEDSVEGGLAQDVR